MDCRLDGKTAIVTGSSKGIGQGIAEEFGRSGASVTVTWHHDKDGAEKTAATIREAGSKAQIVQVDVSQEAEVEAMVDSHMAEFGRLDIMVANAGIGGRSKLHEMPTETWNRVLGTNLHGPFFCARRASQEMIRQGQGGRIITISSVHEEAPSPGGGAYHVSKGGLRNLMRAMALELGEFGITVNGIAPGMTVTPLNGQILADPKLRQQRADMIALHEAGYPKDIANMATYLASDAGSYCTGSTFFVDGGWMLTWPPV